MALTDPVLIGSADATNTCSWTAVPAGDLLILVAKRNLAASGGGAWPTITAGVDLDNDWRYAVLTDTSLDYLVHMVFVRSDGTETSVTWDEMSSGTRRLEVYQVEAPAVPGDWLFPDYPDEDTDFFSEDLSVHVEGYRSTSGHVIPEPDWPTPGQGAWENDYGAVDEEFQYLHTVTDHSMLFASMIYSSSITSGHEGDWPGFWEEHAGNRFHGSTGSILVNSDDEWGHTSYTFDWDSGSNRSGGALAVVAVSFGVWPYGAEPTEGTFVSAELTAAGSPVESLGGPGFLSISPASLLLTPSEILFTQAQVFASAALVLDATFINNGLPRTLHGPPLETYVTTLDKGQSQVTTLDDGLALAAVVNSGVSTLNTEDDGSTIAEVLDG